MRHIPELDGIRGIAALLVFFHHVCYAGLSYLPKQQGWPESIHALYRVAAFGGQGVDLFFVLSGFLITSLLLQQRGSTRFYQDFYWKRVLRIAPLYFTILLLVLVVMHQYLFVALAAFFLANFASVLHMSGFGPFWTLAIEEQFYLVWPAVVRRRTVAQIGRWAFAVGLLAVSLRFALAFTGHHNYFLSFLRCDGLAFGALLACHFQRAGKDTARRQSVDKTLLTLLAAGILLIYCATLPLPIAFASALAQTGTTLLAGPLVGLAIAHTGSTWLMVLRSQVLTFFGLISYALYMIHLYVLAGWDRYYGELHAGDVRDYWLRLGLVLLLTVALSVLSRYVLELPAMRLRRFVLKHPNPDAETAHPPLPLAPM